ncbi:nitrogen regulatory protein P-II [Chondrocystis sp. NIES-4102]|nr:nitrogen regulatory protein P-II [Chondrocystis sp. NIES-4102]
MQPVHKVEIIISSIEVNQVLDLLDRTQVSGYTVIEHTTGKGDRGLTDSNLGRAFSNTYILTVCTNEKQLNFLVEEITPLLKKVGGICLVADANWINH